MLSSVLNVGSMVMAETAVSGSWNGVTSESLMAIADQAKEIVPIALPAVIVFVGLRKGVGFLLGLLRGA